MEKLKLLLGGSPCTHWSIAQTKNRETEPSGIGWELFQNYTITRAKYQPDFFLYENNKSMSPAIRAQITRELGVEPILINSALVSAQNRQRLYWGGKRNPDGTYSRLEVEQPEDRGILLRDILESGICWREKSYTLKANYRKTSDESFVDGGKFPAPGAAEPVRIGTVESTAKNADFDSQQYRVYSPDGKSVTLCGNGGGVGAKTGLYAVPFDEANYELINGAEIFISNGKIRQGDSAGSKQGKYVYTELTEKSNVISAGQAHNEKVLVPAPKGKWKTIYIVRDGQITIKGQQYPIKLPDGYYIIRKLTVTECKRLQTVPDDYIFPVSDTQAYKMLGNGWTVDVIAHILSHIPKIAAEPVEVLSMYDGMSCGHIALDKLGANVVRYYATEIDKYAVKTTQANYPGTVQLGDAFRVRNDGWNIPARACEI